MIAVAVGDPEATRTVYAVVIALAAIGVVLIIVAVWLVRQTRVDPELLAPLERMDTRRWERRDPATQRRMLDEVRPEGAEPLHRERAVPAVDEEFEAELPAVAGFDDLKDGAGVAPAAAVASPDESADEEPVAADEDASAGDGSAEPVADEESVAAPETGDDVSPDEETVADDASLDEGTVDGVDEEPAPESGGLIGDRPAAGRAADPDDVADAEDAADPDAEDAADPDDGPAATTDDGAGAEGAVDADGEHDRPAEGAVDAGDAGDGDDAAGGSDPVDRPATEASEDPDDSRRSAVVSAQD